MIVVSRIYKDAVQDEGISTSAIVTVNDDVSGMFRWVKIFDGHQINSIKVEETVREIATKIVEATNGVYDTPF
jgi:hypothetical protein